MPNLTQPDIDEDIVEPEGPTFKMFSGVLKAFEREIGGSNRRYLSCTASSTIEDLHGDVMTDECVMDMAPQAKAKGMTIFLNHSYKWPEDIAGKTTDARITQRSRDADGRAIYDMDLEIEINDANSRAIESFAAIKDQGIKAGISIGAEIIDWAFRDEDQGWWGGLEIKKVNLLEASIVGIPANQRSWVINGLQALGAPKMIVRKAVGLPYKGPAQPELTEAEWDAAYINNLPDSAFACIDAGGTKDESGKTTPRSKRHYPHHNASGAVDQAHLNNALSRLGDSSNTQCGGAHLKGHKGSDSDSEKAVEHIHTHEVVEETEVSEEANPPDVEATPAPDAETPDEAEDTSAETVEEDTETTEKSAPTTETTVAELKAAGIDSSMLEIVLGFLEGATEEVVSLRNTNKVLTDERDEAKRQAEEAVRFVEELAQTPLGRKAQFAGPVSTFRTRFGAIYEESFLKLLERENASNE